MRNLWLQVGDKNTSFFHKQATIRISRNNIIVIIDKEGNMHTYQKAIKSAAYSHYKNLLPETTELEDYSDFLAHLPNLITDEINSSLTKEIKEVEIRNAIWTLHPNKSPALDGFTISVFRTFWDVIKKDLTKIIQWVQRKKKIGGFTNSTFLALIPKENRPTSFSRFRPISLCNSSYKIITKVPHGGGNINIW